MSYIGNSPVYGNFPVDEFTGDGETGTYTLSNTPPSTGSIEVSVGGIVQPPSSYTIVGTTLTLPTAGAAVDNNVAIVVRHMGEKLLGLPGGGITEPESSVSGDTLYHDGSVYTRLAKGTAAQVLKMNSGATAPEWGEDAGLPATGADGNVLTSDGTNWASEAPAGGGGGGGDPMNLWIDGDFTQWLDKITAGTTSAVLASLDHVSTLIRYEAGEEGAEYTGVRSTDVPTQVESGHASKYSLKMLNSGDNGGTVEDWDYARIVYAMTGSDYAFIHGEQDVILQFWVKSSMTGTYTVGVQNSTAAASRAMPIEYTITAADTWEKKSIAITTDSASETYDLDEEWEGIRIVFSLLSGGDFHGTDNTWAGDHNYYSTDQQVNHGATQGGTFFLSQIGLYKTDTAPASYIGDAIPVVKNKVGYYFRKSYRDFDAPGTAQQIGMVRTEGEFDTSLGGMNNSRTATVTFGARARNQGDGTQPNILIYDSAGNENKISLWDLGTESTNETGDIRYHCESGFQVYTDNSTARNGMSFHYRFDVRHEGLEGMM